MPMSVKPSQRSILCFVNDIAHTSIIDRISIVKSMVVIPPKSRIGEIKPVIPRMARILKTLEPTTLPMAMPLCPLRADMMEVASSGSDVPPATIVRPMMASDTPNCSATMLAPLSRGV